MAERHDSDAAATGEEAEWIEWNGGEQPVADDTRVMLKFAGGDYIGDFVSDAGDWCWKERGSHGITAYRVVAA